MNRKRLGLGLLCTLVLVVSGYVWATAGTSNAQFDCETTSTMTQGSNSPHGVYSASGTTCANNETIAYRDQDGDTDYIAGICCFPVSNPTSTSLSGFTTSHTNLDCNDTSTAFSHSASEITGDSIDQNCDGAETCFDDDDDDGFLDATNDTRASTDTDCTDANEGTTTDLLTDCNDAVATIFPGATEVVGDSVDQSCNGSETCYDDDDNDGYLDTSGDTRVSTDADCADANEGTNADLTTDCDDTLATRSPGLPEICDGSNLDEDCDGNADDLDVSGTAPTGRSTFYIDADNDSYGTSATGVGTFTLACDLPSGYATLNTDCNDSSSSIKPGVAELPGDSVDQNCDALETCYDDDDNDGYLDTSGDTRPSTDTDCADANEGTTTDLTTDCDDTLATRNPGLPEICDGSNLDEDCDGNADDLDVSGTAPTGRSTFYRDADGDTYGTSVTTTAACDQPSGYVSNSTDCDDTTATRSPGNTEVCDAANLDENCNSLADDLDSSVSAGTKTTFYRDLDSDTYGNPSSTVSKCDLPAGYVSNSADCNDNSNAINPLATEICDSTDTDEDCDGVSDDDDSSVNSAGRTTFYQDTDNDTYGSSGTALSLCDQPSGYVTSSTDCNDAVAAINPGATETCDSLDNDCDGQTDETGSANQTTWYRDADADGYGDLTHSFQSCSQPSNFVSNSTDCNDGSFSVHPNATETCNSVDDDCDGGTDESGSTGETTWYRDLDGDGYGNPAAPLSACSQPAGYVSNNTDCDDADAGDHPGATETIGNSDDENCDGSETCYDDDDNDGYLDATADTRASSDADCDDANEGTLSDLTTDCDDSDAGDYPGATETIDNGDDEDCSGGDLCYDDDDNDGYLDATGDTRVSNDLDCQDIYEGRPTDPTTDCDDTDSGDYPGATETIDNGDDENCDGFETCYNDDDNDNYLDSTSDTIASVDTDCLDIYEGRSTDPTTDCNDNSASVYPGAQEIVQNGIDEDCDGSEACYDDDDDDGYLDNTNDTIASSDTDCLDPHEGAATDPTTDCNDNDATIHPGATEITGDGIDEDCSSGTEICYNDDDNDGYLDGSSDTIVSSDSDCNDAYEGSNTDLTTDCDDNDLGDYPGAPEVVGNGDDEDCDGTDACYDDDDNDGYLDSSGDTRPSADADCDDPYEGKTTDPTTDCNDNDATVYPNATEIIGDSIDENCDTLETCYDDDDDDGYLDATGDTRTSNDSDCQDIYEGTATDLITDCDDNDGGDYPGAIEVVGNGDDENCNGSDDCYVDNDNDGHLISAPTTAASADTDCSDANEGEATDPRDDCDDNDPADYLGATEVVGNSDDENCDGTELCYSDLDDDGHIPFSATTRLSADTDCLDTQEGTDSDYVNHLDDCDDTDAGDYRGATEIVGNADDEDCDGRETCFLDADNDGYLDNFGATTTSQDLDCDDINEGTNTDPTTDCNDSNANIHPNTTEPVGDSVDQNCDGLETCYTDNDNDGYRPDGTSTVFSNDTDCADAQEALATDPITDCDDADAGDYPGASETIGNDDDEDCDSTEICFLDSDDDGYRPNATSSIASADTDCLDPQEARATDPSSDCDDTDAGDHPGATEITGNSDDEDCDLTEICYDDDDNDGYLDSTGDTTISSNNTVCTDVGEGTDVTPTSDCDDNDSSIHPGATETSGDNIDKDCDGSEICFIDADDDGARIATVFSSSDSDCTDPYEGELADQLDCDDADALVYPGIATNELNDTLCMRDHDLDGWGDDEASGSITPGTDCDDNDVFTMPRSNDSNFEGLTFGRYTLDASRFSIELQNDLSDGVLDGCYTDADSDNYGDSNPTDPDAIGGTDCDDDLGNGGAHVSPGEDEACETSGEQIDNDCDGSFNTDWDIVGDASGLLELYPDTDGDGYGRDDVSPTIGCASGSGWSTLPIDCDDDLFDVNPGAHEICNEIDDDCNRKIDDNTNGDPGGCSLLYLDYDHDGYGDAAIPTCLCDGTDQGIGNEEYDGQFYVDSNNDCDDYDNEIHPEITDCGDGRDNDGDGGSDAGNDVSADAECAPALCVDGLDNDGDGLIDHDDIDCDGVCGSNGCFEDGIHRSGISDCDDGIDNDSDGSLDLGLVFDADCSPALCLDNVDNDADGKTDRDDTDCDGACGRNGCFEDGQRHEEEKIDGSDNDCDSYILALELDCDDDGAMPALLSSNEDWSVTTVVHDFSDAGVSSCGVADTTTSISCWDNTEIQLLCKANGLWAFRYTTSEDGWTGRFVGGRREYPNGKGNCDIAFDCDDQCASRCGGEVESCDSIDNDCQDFSPSDADSDGIPNALDPEGDDPRTGYTSSTELDLDRDGFLSCGSFDPDADQHWATDFSCSDSISDPTLLDDCNDRCALVYPGIEASCDGFTDTCDAAPLGDDGDRDGHQSCGAWSGTDTTEGIYVLAAFFESEDSGGTDTASATTYNYLPLLLPRRRVSTDDGSKPLWYNSTLSDIGDIGEDDIELCDIGLYQALKDTFPAASGTDARAPVDEALATNDPGVLAALCSTVPGLQCGILRLSLSENIDEVLWDSSSDTHYSTTWAAAEGVLESSCMDYPELLITRSMWPADRIREARYTITEWECYQLYGKSCLEVRPTDTSINIREPDPIGFSFALESDERWWKEIGRYEPAEVVSGSLEECWGDPSQTGAVSRSDVGGDCADGNSGASRDKPEGPGDLVGAYLNEAVDCSACLDGIDNNCDGQADCADPSCAICFVGEGYGCAAPDSPCKGAGCEATASDSQTQSYLMSVLALFGFSAIRRVRR